MPLSRARRPPDLDRVASVLGARPPTSGGGWVPHEPQTGGPAKTQADPTTREGQAGLRAEIDAEQEIARLEADLRRARRPAVLTVPEHLRLGRVSVSSAVIVALLALVVALGCLFALRVLWAERAADAEATGGPGQSTAASGVQTGTATRPGRGSAPPGTQSTPGAPSAKGEVVVHVAGQVQRPGLVRLPTSARVADALTAAGGSRTTADLAALNLARPLVDGEQVYVPRTGEVRAGGGSVSGEAGGAGGTTQPAGSGSDRGPVNLNSADVSALDGLPGVGPVLAQRIIDWRVEHGRFTSVDELGEVSGIGDKLLAQLRPKVTL